MPSTNFRLGKNCVIARNTGTYGSPTWNPLGNTRDVTLPVEKDEWDATRRDSGGWEEIIATIKKGGVEFDMVYMATDADFIALETAFFTDAAIEFFIADGPVATAGTRGLRATCEIMRFSRDEKLKEGVVYRFGLKPTPADNAPEWKIVV